MYKKIKAILICAALMLIYLPGVMASERLAVASSVANIRSGPGNQYDILWKAEKYYPINILVKEGPWYKFSDFEGDIGWIHKSLVKKISCVITKLENCYVRSGPGKNYEVILTAEAGIPFKVIKREKKWLNVQHVSGISGWIHSMLVW